MRTTTINLPPPVLQYFDPFLLCPEINLRKRLEFICTYYKDKILRMPKRIQKKIQETIKEFETEYDALQKKKDDDKTKTKPLQKKCFEQTTTVRFRRYRNEGN